MRVWFTFAAHLVTAVATIIDSITSLLQRHTLAVYTSEATRCVCKNRKINVTILGKSGAKYRSSQDVPVHSGGVSALR